MSTENSSTAVVDEIPNLLITPTAQEYLKDLLAKQNTPGIGVRVFVENPGTPRANVAWLIVRPMKLYLQTTNRNIQTFLHLLIRRLFHIYWML